MFICRLLSHEPPDTPKLCIVSIHGGLIQKLNQYVDNILLLSEFEEVFQTSLRPLKTNHQNIQSVEEMLKVVDVFEQKTNMRVYGLLPLQLTSTELKDVQHLSNKI